MKRILRHFVIDTVSIYLVSSVASGLVFQKGIETLLLTGLGLTIASLIAKPVIKPKVWSQLIRKLSNCRDSEKHWRCRCCRNCVRNLFAESG